MPDDDELLIRRYYQAFNDRQLAVGAALVSPDCQFNHLPTRERARGPLGYRALVDEWVSAAADVTLTPERIVPVGSGAYQVLLRVRGRMDGTFEIRPLSQVTGDGHSFDFRASHELTFRGGQIIASTFSYDLGHLIAPT